MAPIVWLASYPRSGNTWLRLLVAHFEHPDAPPGFDLLAAYPSAAARALFDDVAGVDSSDLTADEVDLLRPRVYERLAADDARQRVLKVHDAWLPNADGAPCFPAAATAGVIYAVRDPLDVAVSLAHHMGRSLDAAVALVCDERAALGASPRSGSTMLRERLGSWSTNVRSWVDAPGLRRCVVRYEDLCAEPEATVATIVAFLGHAPDPARVRRAVYATRFGRLQAMEAEHGFRDAQPRRTAPFFRRGRPGGGREALDAAQVGRIVAAHGETMRRFGYLPAAAPADADGSPRARRAHPVA